MSEVIYCVRCAGEGEDVPAERHVFHLTHFSTTGKVPMGLYTIDLCNRHFEDFRGLFRPYVARRKGVKDDLDRRERP